MKSDFYTIKMIANSVAKDSCLKKKHKDFSFPFIPLLNSLTGISLEPTMGLTLLDVVYSLLKEVVSA